MTWAAAFGATLAIEVPLAIALLRTHPASRVAIIAVLATAASHPLLWFGFRGLPWPFLARVIAGELVVIAIEAVVYRIGLRLRWGYAFASSAVLNAISYTIGLALA